MENSFFYLDDLSGKETEEIELQVTRATCIYVTLLPETVAVLWRTFFHRVLLRTHGNQWNNDVTMNLM